MSLSKELVETHPIPEKPREPNIPEAFKDIWILYYLASGNPNPLVRFFHFEGNTYEAVARTKEHCRIMGYRHLFVLKPFIDMDYDEHMRLNPSERK